ncbi:MAG TPA: hypothetical protein PLP42_03680 [Acidobacteriota bacterium]|nr:hypothetical protein [Acidobacteriota bacterium]
MQNGKGFSRKWPPNALVALRSDPTRKGVILRMSRDGRVASVQFENYPRPTTHAVEGLVLISSTPQLELFEKESKRAAS